MVASISSTSSSSSLIYYNLSRLLINGKEESISQMAIDKGSKVLTFIFNSNNQKPKEGLCSIQEDEIMTTTMANHNKNRTIQILLTTTMTAQQEEDENTTTLTNSKMLIDAKWFRNIKEGVGRIVIPNHNMTIEVSNYNDFTAMILEFKMMIGLKRINGPEIIYDDDDEGSYHYPETCTTTTPVVLSHA